MDPNTGLGICRICIFVGAFMVAAGTLIGSHFTSKIDSKKEAKIDELKVQIDVLVKGKNELIVNNKELISKVEKYQIDLKEKEEKIKQLEIKSKKAERGVSSSFDFEGVKRITTRPGFVQAIAGEEAQAFQDIIRLEKGKNFPELISICEQQIKKSPDWLTPYFFLGIAYANTGVKDKAISNLEHVIENAPGDPAYVQAEAILKKIKEESN